MSPKRSTIKLNTEQKRAVTHGDGPLLIIAGAGTGKTTVVTERIKYLITKKKIDPQHILALTFTEKASREMEDRVDRALPYGMTEMWISTFHAFCDRVLRAEALHIGLDPGYKLMTEAETVMFFQNHLFSFDLSYFRPLGNPMKFVRGMLTHFSRLKDEDIAPKQYLAWVKKQETRNKKQKIEKEQYEQYLELAQAYRTYEELKVKEGVMDYGDLISNTLRLFRSRESVLARFQEQFKFVLIDEFQDTNYAQNLLGTLLAGTQANITVVGDDDQAIYRWRGAALSNILEFRKTYPKAATVVLTKNYRSTKEILDRSYALIQHNNPDRLEHKETIEKKLTSMRRVRGEPIEFLFTDRVENEADTVVRTIERLIADSDAKYSWKDIAILVRANNHAEPFTRALGRAGIPYQFLGPGQLFRQAEVKDLIAYLKVLYSFEDNVAMYRVLSLDVFGVPPRDVAVVSNYAKRYGVSLFEASEKWDELSLSSEGKKKIGRIVHLVRTHLGIIKKESAGQILYYFLQETGLLEQFTSFDSAKEERTAGNIAKFFDKLKTYEVDHDDASVFAVVDWIDLSMQLGESPAATDTDWTENNAVNILTVHSSKGLEFPVVFLVNLVSARFPTRKRREQIPIPDALVKEAASEGDYHLQEERRLFYVGMTRARDRVFLTAANYYGEGKREKKLSLFISETLGEERVDAARQAPEGDTKQLSLIAWDKKEEPDAKPVRQAIRYVSYTQLSTFKTCPLQYKYRYILKIPVPPSAALTFGSTIHRVVTRFYEDAKAGKSPTKNDLLGLLEDEWSSIGFKNRQYEEKMKRRGVELLKGFYANAYDPDRLPADLEQPFKLKITPDLTVGGRIDRVDRHDDGTLEIIDYKTGQAPKRKNIARDLQLSVYALAAVDKGIYDHPVEKVRVSFYFLDGGETVSATRTKEDLDKARTTIADTARAMSTSTFKPTPGKHCDFCEFRLICEAWQ